MKPKYPRNKVKKHIPLHPAVSEEDQATVTPLLEKGILHERQRRGLVMVITGNGKGKTTSALGQALRSLGLCQARKWTD